MTDWRLRLRAFLDGRFAVAVAVLLVIAALGGWLTVTAHTAENENTPEVQSTTAMETTGEFAHSATVETNTTVFREGETLENRSVYFTRVSPTLNGTFLFTYDGSDEGSVDENVSLGLVIRGVESGDSGQRETVLWQTTRPLNDVSTTDVTPGETVRVPFTLDMNRVTNRTERIRDELGGSPGETDVLVRATVDYEGTIGNETVDRTRSYTLPVSLNGNTYSPGTNATRTNRGNTTQQVADTRTAGLLSRVGAPLLVVTALVGLTGLAIGRVRGQFELSDAERERLAYERDREDYDEWISTVRLPDEAFDRPRAEAASLGSLVDIAIDTDNSVVEAPEQEMYYVLHDGYLYTYEPPLLGE